MSYNLFLDDQRNPKDAILFDHNQKLSEYSNIPNGNWEIVRSYNEFVEYVNKHGIPATVSFDHDLSFEHIRHYFEVTQATGMIEYGNLKEKTGKQCAEFLVDKIKKTDMVSIPTFFIHSANEYGRIEIEKTLKELKYDK